MKDAMRVLVTGGAGQIAYQLCARIGSGEMLGFDQPIDLVLLDIPPAEKALRGVALELEDLAFPLVRSLTATVSTEEAFAGVEVACLVGARPRGPGMERKDLLEANAKIFEVQGRALEAHASRNVKVVVVGNPANTNAAIAAACAPSIPKRNFTALTRLDHNRALAMLAIKAGVPVGSVDNAIIWGNHSATQYPDWHHAALKGTGERLAALVADDDWLKGTFVPAVQKRGAAIIKARKVSSAMSAAKAVSDHVRDWVRGTSAGTIVSMAVPSDGSYGIPEGLVYSFPVVCAGGDYAIVQDLAINEYSRAAMDATKKELEEERATAFKHLFGTAEPKL